MLSWEYIMHIITCLFLVVGFYINSYGFEHEIVTSFLSDVNKHSLEIKILGSQNESSHLTLNKELLMFNTTGFLKGSYSNQENAQTSPFSSAQSTVYEYGAGLSKLWTSGIKSELSYSLQDSNTSFYSGANNAFIAPTLSLSLKANIFQDIFAKRYQHLEKRNLHQKESEDLEHKINQKNLLAQSLVDYSYLLEVKEELKLQAQLCEKTKIQARKLEEKNKRQSVSKREYLLSLKSYNQCQTSVSEIEKKMSEQTQNFIAKYNFDVVKYTEIKLNHFYNEINSSFDKLKMAKEGFQLSDNDAVKAIQTRVEASRERQKELDALTAKNISLELKAGATGLDNNVSDSHENLSELKYPFVYVGLRLELPLEDRSAKMDAGANAYQLMALESQESFVKAQNLNRYEVLKAGLEKDFDIFKKHELSVKYSKDVFNEAIKDFDNGRLDFFAVTEFHKNLLQDQKVLSSHRIQLLAKIVEFLDFHHFFEKFL